MTGAALAPPPSRGRVLTDGGAVAVAAAVVVGAWWHRPLPVVIGAVVAGVALAGRRPMLLVAAGLLLGAALGHRAWSGMDPAEPRAFAGPVTLVADPTETPYGIRVDVRAGGHRYELRASGTGAGTIGRARAGERLRVTGRITPRPPDAPWLIPRHVVGRLAARQVDPIDAGAAPWRAANRFRALLDRGAAGLDPTTRALYGGFVLGDDRGQPPEVVDDFRAAGLTHLLVVSGQNVAFLLVVVSPLLHRLGLAGRWAVTVAVIGAFGVVTRFEPSVLRASAMAAVAVTATLAGRPGGALRTLALAVAGVVLVDPLLVWSVGFQLSVGASLGIVVVGPWLAARVRGPRWWAEAVAVTVAAQVGVLPVLVPRFGGMPVVSVPANLLAVPVAGLVTTWGLPAGIVAGVVGGRVAGLAHVPTRWCIGWVAGVARAAAGLPLGELGFGEAAVAAGAVAAVVGWRWWGDRAGRDRSAGDRWMTAAAAVLVVAAVLAPGWRLRSPPTEAPVGGGARVYRAGGATVLVVGRSAGVGVGPLLEGLRRAGVRRLDLVVSARPVDPAMLRALRHRWSVGPVRSGRDAPVAQRVGGLSVRSGGGAEPVVTVGPGP